MSMFPRIWRRGVGDFCQFCGLASTFLVGLTQAATPPAEDVDFLRDVRPILASHCLKCHGPDDEARKAKLRLDIRDLSIQAAKSGERPIVPGHPEQSELVRRIFAQDED